MYLQLAENTEHPQLAGLFSGLKKLSLKKIVKGVEKAAKGAVKGIKKIGLAVPRNAYLGLVALNVHSVASKLKRAIDTDPNKVKSKWESLGGNFSDFKKAINSGAKKKHLLENFGEYEETHYVLSEGEGDTVKVQLLSTPAVPAIIATATPIIAALAPLLKQFTKPEDSEGVPAGTPDLETQAASIDPENYVDPTDPAHAGKYDTEKGVTISKGLGVSTPVIIGAVALGAFLLLRKK